MSDPNNTTKASLGCGSLILIAIIVLIFGNRGSDKDLLREVRDARSEIKELKAEVATQSTAISRLESAVKASQPNPRTPRPRVTEPPSGAPELAPE